MTCNSGQQSCGVRYQIRITGQWNSGERLFSSPLALVPLLLTSVFHTVLTPLVSDLECFGKEHYPEDSAVPLLKFTAEAAFSHGTPLHEDIITSWRAIGCLSSLSGSKPHLPRRLTLLIRIRGNGRLEFRSFCTENQHTAQH